MQPPRFEFQKARRQNRNCSGCVPKKSGINKRQAASCASASVEKAAAAAAAVETDHREELSLLLALRVYHITRCLNHAHDAALPDSVLQKAATAWQRCRVPIPSLKLSVLRGMASAPIDIGAGGCCCALLRCGHRQTALALDDENNAVRLLSAVFGLTNPLLIESERFTDPMPFLSVVVSSLSQQQQQQQQSSCQILQMIRRNLESVRHSLAALVSSSETSASPPLTSSLLLSTLVPSVPPPPPPPAGVAASRSVIAASKAGDLDEEHDDDDDDDDDCHRDASAAASAAAAAAAAAKEKQIDTFPAATATAVSSSDACVRLCVLLAVIRLHLFSSSAMEAIPLQQFEASFTAFLNSARLNCGGVFSFLPVFSLRDLLFNHGDGCGGDDDVGGKGGENKNDVNILSRFARVTHGRIQLSPHGLLLARRCISPEAVGALRKTAASGDTHTFIQLLRTEIIVTFSAADSFTEWGTFIFEQIVPLLDHRPFMQQREQRHRLSHPSPLPLDNRSVLQEESNKMVDDDVLEQQSGMFDNKLQLNRQQESSSSSSSSSLLSFFASESSVGDNKSAAAAAAAAVEATIVSRRGPRGLAPAPPRQEG